MKISREARRQARELFDLAMVNGRLDNDRVRRIADGVVGSHVRETVPLLKEFSRLVRLETERHHAIVESAAPLSPDQQRDFEKNLRSRFGAVSAEFRLDPSLIAGVRVKIGSDVWDGSVQARLQALQQIA